MSDPVETTPEVTSPIIPSPSIYSSILKEHDVIEKQRQARKDLLKKMEGEKHNNGKAKNAVVAHIAKQSVMGSSLDQNDIPVLGSILRSIGDVNFLNLILHSPGGDGTCVEKFVSLCRAQCKRFRVIIPNSAKSAATMIALGADEIIMGHSSEIGPIDAQVPVMASGVGRYISAQSFIDARNSLLEQYNEAIKKKEDTRPFLQMLASLDIPHIEECQRMMDFGREVARNLLTKYMLKGKNGIERIDKIVDMLSSVKKHKVHGRLIDGSTARTELGLKVKLLAKDDPFWQLVWEYYTRAEISLSNAKASKMFETTHEVLLAR